MLVGLPFPKRGPFIWLQGGCQGLHGGWFCSCQTRKKQKRRGLSAHVVIRRRRKERGLSAHVVISSSLFSVVPAIHTERRTVIPGKEGSSAAPAVPPPALRVTVQIVTPPTSRRISSGGRPAFKCSWRKRFCSLDHDGNGHLSQSVREKRTSSGCTQ